MIRVQVAATCNNSCVFCAQAGRFDAADATRIAQGPHGVDAVGSPVGVAPLDPGHLARGVDARLKALSKSAEPVMLIGGEPTLDPALCEYVRRLAAGGAAVVLQTNARLLGCRVDAAGAVASQGDATLAEALKGAGLTAVEVALYGSTAALHDYHTRCPGSFRQTVSGVRASRSAGLRCALTTLVTRSNYRHLAELVRLGHALGVVALAIRSVLPEGRAAGSQGLQPPRQMLAPHLRAAQQLGRQLGLELLIEPASADNYTDSSSGAGSESISLQKLVSRQQAAPRTGEWAAQA